MGAEGSVVGLAFAATFGGSASCGRLGVAGGAIGGRPGKEGAVSWGWRPVARALAGPLPELVGVKDPSPPLGDAPPANDDFPQFGQTLLLNGISA